MQLQEDIKDTTDEDKISNYRPKVLVLSSGGTKGIGMIGTLQILHSEGILNEIETYIGTSVGAVISLLLVAGYTLNEILALALHSTVLLTWKEMYKLDRAYNERGLVPHEKVTQPMKEMVIRKFGKVPTLRELYDITHKHLICVTTNIEQDGRKAQYLDYINNPNLSCIDAMTASMLVIGIIAQIRIDGKLCVDGVFTDPYPARYVDDGNREVIGVAIVGTDQDPSEGYLTYLYTTLSITFDKLQELTRERLSEKVRTIELRLPDISVLDRAIDINKRLKCYNAGVLVGMHYVARLNDQTYEEKYGISVMPTTFTEVASHNVKHPRHGTQHGPQQRNIINRIGVALSGIKVPHVQQ